MRAGFIQFSPQFGKVDTNIDKALAMLEKADAELIVLPELFNTGYLFVSRDEALAMAEEIPAGKTIKALSSIARKKKIHIVAGIAESAGENLYNSAVLISPKGYMASYRAGLFRSSFIGTAKRTSLSAPGAEPVISSEVWAKVSRPMTPGT